MISSHSVLTAILLAFLPITASASIISAWNFEGVDLDATGASGIDGNSTTSPFTFSAGEKYANVQSAQLTLSQDSFVNPSTTVGRYGFKISQAGGHVPATNLAGAISAGQYLEFTITASVGFVFNLTSIQMYGEATNTGAADVALLSSVDGFVNTAAIATVSNIPDNNTGDFDADTGSSGFGQPIDLSASKFQNLASISFRIYGWSTTDGSGSTYLRNGVSGNDLIINGSMVAVPEPSTSLPLGLAIASTILFRRKRRKQS